MPKFNKATLAALLVSAAPLVVQAADITIDFEGLPTGLIAGNAYAPLGVAFTGQAVVQQHLAPTATLGLNYVRSLTSFVLDVVNPAVTDFNILSFDYLGPIRLSVQGVKGAVPDVFFDPPSLTGWQTYSLAALDLNVFGLIDAITFSVNTLSVDAQFGFGIDNVRLSVQTPNPPTPPGTVPEPATYGLLAMALLGVGLATRRRS